MNVKQDVSQILAQRPDGETNDPPQESMYEAGPRAFAALGLKVDPGKSQEDSMPEE